MKILKKNTLSIALVLALLSAVMTPALAASPDLPKTPSYVEINLSNSEKSTPLVIPIDRRQSIAYHWQPWQKIKVWAYVQHPGGRAESLKDRDGKSFWEVRLNSYGEGELKLFPAVENYTGRLIVKGNGKILSMDRAIEKTLEYRFPDGVSIKVYYTDQLLEQSRQESYFPKQVLDAAVSAYQTITQFQGFNTQGYSLAAPDKSYAHDPDKTIDIYLGDPKGGDNFSYHGFNPLSFKDAPCFDTVRVSETGFHGVILLPTNYQDFIKNWETINPSPLGVRNIEVDLRGTLIHEMLHVILFYYNRNLNKDLDGPSASEGIEASAHGAANKKLDWYVEGLARYFETLAGARHDFYSQGFKQVLPDKIRFSRGGSNYFMRYPDQSFMDLRYENALFWRFMDYRYGMSSIERLSREFRGFESKDFKSALEKVTGDPFSQLLKEFAVSILLKDFGLKEDDVYLKAVARTRLVYRDEELYLKDGHGSEKHLGPICRTDWVGEWGDSRARHGGPAAAGDNTERSDVSGWATDYYEIDIDPEARVLPEFDIPTENSNEALTVQVLLVTRGGSTLKREKGAYTSLEEEIRKEGLTASDIRTIYLLITNTDSLDVIPYQISVRA